MRDFGIVHPGTTLYIPFATYDSNDPSASVTNTGLAVTDIEVYKDGSVTQRASDAGYTLLDTDGIDFDAITGIHGFSINLADNTTAGFWAAGSQYWVIVSAITVDAATVNFIAATFRIGVPGALLNTTIATLASQTSFTLTNGPAEDDAINGAVVYIHDVASAVQGGFAVVSDYTGSTKTVTLTAATTYTAAATDNIAIFPPANTAWMGRNGAIAQTGNDVGADVDAILVDTGTTLDARIPAALVSGRMDASIGAAAADTITASALAADAATEIANAVWDTDATGRQTQGTFGQAIGDPGADTNTIFKAVVTDATGATVGVDVAAVLVDTAEIGAAGAGLTAINLPDQTMNITGDITGNLSGSVGSVAAGGITAASIATGAIDADAIATDAVTEIRSIVSGTADSGTTTTMVDAARTEADTDYWKDNAILFTSGTISGQVRLITAFNAATDTITFSPATTQAVGTNTYEILPNVAAAGASAPTAAEVADAVWDEAQADHVAVGSFGITATEIADILVDTGTTLQAEVDGIQADTEDIQTRLPAALVSGRIDASVGAVAANAITAASIAADAGTEIAAAVWDRDATLSQTQGTFGQAIGDSAADANTIYGAVVTGATGATIAADIITIDDFVDTEVAAIKAKTDQLTFTTANQVDAQVLSMAAGTVTAAAIATNAFDADALAADAVTEIQAGLSTLDAAGVRTAVGLAAANLDTQLDALPTAAEVATAVVEKALADVYAANGAAPTLQQAVMAVHQAIMDFEITSTSKTVRKLDGTTTAFVQTLDSATAPTATTRT